MKLNALYGLDNKKWRNLMRGKYSDSDWSVFLFDLVAAHPDRPGKKAVKQVSRLLCVMLRYLAAMLPTFCFLLV